MQRGFTLIELSIVLVIIGLIVGGVLVGQDLIRAAEIRATVGQIEKNNAAVNTFRSKYNALPGDMRFTNAMEFGLFAELPSFGGTPGHQDGNGIIEGGASGATTGLGEPLEFWRHLTDANLIDGSYGVSGNSRITDIGRALGNVTTIGESLPAAKLGRNNYIAVYAVNGVNHYQIAPINGLTAATGVYGFGAYGISPIDSYNIDAKIDDGSPNTGLLIARGIAAVNATPSVNPASMANVCTIGLGSGNPTDTYNRLSGTGGTDPSCSLRLRFN